MLLERMIRAARLDSNLYEEVEADLSATSQAATVVGIVAICNGLGAGIGTAMAGDTTGAVVSFIVGVFMAFLLWIAWSYITYFVGTSLFKGQATPGEILRTAGFAESPLVLSVLSFIPIIGGIIALVAFVMFLIAGVIALRQALDISTGQAVITALIGLVPLVLVVCFLGAVVGLGGAAMGGAFR